MFLNENIRKDKKIKKVTFFVNLESKLSLLSINILKGIKIDNAISVKPPYLNAGWFKNHSRSKSKSTV